MIKILMCGNHASNKGGMTSVIQQILSFDWGKSGVSIKFIPTYYPANNLVKAFYFVHAYIRIFIYLLVRRPQIVHVHMSCRGSFYRAYMIRQLCCLFHIKDLIHLHGSEFMKWYDSLDATRQGKVKKLLRECTTLIVLGDVWKSRILEIEPRTRIAALSNTVPIPGQRASWNSNPFQILFLGVLIKRKGIYDLLDAMKILLAAGDRHCLRLVISGTGYEEQALKKKCSNSQFGQTVQFVGWTDGEKKRKLLSQSQMLVLPSYNEGLPVAVLEAISYGLPVVASDVGDMKAAVHDSENGYLVAPGDPAALSQAIEKLLDIPQCEWEKFSTASRRIAENKFSDSNYMDSLLKLYRAP